ncbi:LamG domain-containing protein [Paraburkholderia bengalensis]|uniref:LamG domain-containing protein n=1 Tax=Paraburkholderia bengalensis TaxID=2747562 RepID=A0ABU8IR17_9BURK
MSTKIFGYASKISVRPGDDIDVFVSATGATTAQAQLVRLIHGDEHPSGPGFVEREVACDANGAWNVHEQRTQIGSYLSVADTELSLDGLKAFTLFAFVYPSLPATADTQTILGRWDASRNEGYRLEIGKSGKIGFRWSSPESSGEIRDDQTLVAKTWYFIAVTVDPSAQKVTLHRRSVISRYNSLLSANAFADLSPAQFTAPLHVSELATDARFLIGCSDVSLADGERWTAQHFHGKIDRPGILWHVADDDELSSLAKGNAPSVIATHVYWDTSAGYSASGIGQLVVDTGPFGIHAHGQNYPVRGQTGWNWSGRHDSFHTGPHEYGGIEFHADAVIDCKWKVTRRITLPDDLKSGVYAVRLRIHDGKKMNEEYVIFFVRARSPSAKLCLLVPTQSYLAYANEHLSLDAPGIQPMMGQPPIADDVDIEMYQNPEFGYATYDTYADGGGVSYSSYLRPLFTMRPKYRMSSIGTPWQFAADLSIVAWLEQSGLDWELITDEDLHKEGLAALKPYKCVMTGTHPEYVSEEVLDAIEDYVGEGGRLMYLGGNGFYWSVTLDAANPAVMEVRKLDAGHRSWNARPGEHHLALNGRKGGLWKQLNRPPQKIFGIGSIAEGWETGQGYTKMPDSRDPALSWVFEGIKEELIGDFGLAHAGSAGLELDRYDLSKGTPPHTRILASSGEHSDNYVVFQDEIFYMQPGLTGTYDHRIRADMTYFDTKAGGAVFATGAISFGQALPINDFDNNISRLVRNVTMAFLKDDLPSRFIDESSKL